MAPHSSTLAWKTPWTEEPGRLQSMGSLESDTTERIHFHFSLSRIGEGNGNPLRCSCWENPGDGEAWWTAVYGVTQSRTRLKRLSSSSSSLSSSLETFWPGDFNNITMTCIQLVLQGQRIVWLRACTVESYLMLSVKHYSRPLFFYRSINFLSLTFLHE